MAKFPTFPPLYDNAKKLDITELKKWNYLKPGQILSGVITWSRNGNKTGSISITANTQNKPPYIELDYKYGDEPRKYKVYLTSTPSNLNIGEIWYFICPQTGKRCRKLYSIDGYFLHREAFNGCMYESQTRSKKEQRFHKMFSTYSEKYSLYDELFKKHRKGTYAGKPTKRSLRLMELIDKAESIPYNEIEKMYFIK